MIDVDSAHYWHQDYMREKYLKTPERKLSHDLICICGHPEDEHDFEEMGDRCAWEKCLCKKFEGKGE